MRLTAAINKTILSMFTNGASIADIWLHFNIGRRKLDSPRIEQVLRSHIRKLERKVKEKR